MGNELGHFREWDEGREQDWNLLDYPLHQGFLAFHRALNHCYLTAPALWRDGGTGFFTWLQRWEDGLFAFLREGDGQRLLAVFNFLDREQDLSLFLNGATRLQLMLDSDSAAFGGSAQEKPEVPAAKYSGLRLTLPPYSGRLYQVE